MADLTHVASLLKKFRNNLWNTISNYIIELCRRRYRSFNAVQDVDCSFAVDGKQILGVCLANISF